VDGTVSGSPHDAPLRLTVPSQKVAADVVEGEAVIINLDTGAYYTTEGVGCEAWELLASGRTLAEVVEALRDRYDADAGEVEAYVQELAETLLAEGLMLVFESDDGPSAAGSADALPEAETRKPFEPADFVSYHDMRGLLLLDPVHEVEAEGWPHAAAGG
jgi:coenzyme PQQ synthesis protein D (PqqD)